MFFPVHRIRFLTGLVLFLIASGLSGQTGTIRNAHLTVACDSATARWTLSTVQGLPALPSDANHLLTGGSLGSFCIVRIDAVDRRFGGIEGRLRLVSSDASSLTHSWTVGDVEVLQELKLTNSSHASLPASLKVKYWVRNKGTTDRRIGLRIVLDTFLGANDDADILVPDFSYVRTETVFRGASVPDYWCAWDGITAPYVRAVFSFTSPNTVKPDILAFASRRRLAETTWDFFPDNRKDFRPSPLEPPDPAVGMTWEPVRFRPGRENGVAFHFGLQEAAASGLPPLELILASPVTTRTGEVSVIAEIRNADSSRAIRNVGIKLNLPAGASVSGGGNAEQKIAEIPAGGKTFVTWRVRLGKKGSVEAHCVAAGNTGGQVALNQVRQTIIVK